jgi:hypothetical protein
VNAINPYAAPQAELQRPRMESVPGLSVRRGFVIVLATAGAGAILGALVGLFIGLVAPDYYYAVFSGSPGAFSPIKVGMSLGLVQGLFTGLAVGCVIVLAVAISIRRRPVE